MIKCYCAKVVNICFLLTLHRYKPPIKYEIRSGICEQNIPDFLPLIYGGLVELADTTDLKSVEIFSCTGPNPVSATNMLPSSQVVRQRILTPRRVGPNPTSVANIKR